MFGSVFGTNGSWFGPNFSCQLRCYPVAFAGRDELDLGNRIILPPSALQELNQKGASGLMLFEVSDLDGRRHTHAGVLEFIAPEDICYMPSWILQKLQAQEGDILRITLAHLEKATFMRLRPASVALHRVYDPKTLLETGLKNFAVLTDGDNISVEYSGKSYGLEVLEILPNGAACIVDADVEVEFAPPKVAEEAASRIASRATSRGEGVQNSANASEAPESLTDATAAEQPGPAPSTQSRLFTGEGRRIDGEVAAPYVEDDISEDPTPWKRRIPGGVKWTAAPYGYEKVSLTGKVAHFSHEATSLPASEAMLIASVCASRSSEPERKEVKFRTLEAAERRYVDNAEEIEKRRKEEEEEKRQAELVARAEEEKRKAAEEARRQRAQEILQAPAQGQMMQTNGKTKAQSSSSRTSLRSLCSCFFSSSTRNAAPSRV
eukprot:TRINITY_DN8348_c0_g1_i2.p1 TRINITY_DN8348_c0_g1~~TRINITY_DN8348_c0_g1_i2.p1  ORF type:complete len:435 (+),score=97.13 TRINITY_DN8348_c0_g1_i2:45-1349(+)